MAKKGKPSLWQRALDTITRTTGAVRGRLDSANRHVGAVAGAALNGSGTVLAKHAIERAQSFARQHRAPMSMDRAMRMQQPLPSMHESAANPLNHPMWNAWAKTPGAIAKVHQARAGHRLDPPTPGELLQKTGPKRATPAAPATSQKTKQTPAAQRRKGKTTVTGRQMAPTGHARPPAPKVSPARAEHDKAMAARGWLRGKKGGYYRIVNGRRVYLNRNK